ncbi:tyrosine-type recombinase/integrase [Bradyrhizobium sp. SZCCHNS3004]|uniref:tyrosine-type recombinase/integrase n=1 Tax=Bradyrhizobium sp. SZCCHNS3004 TaxID=3057312 RepID=UPI002915F81D|nr:tyrosine-type recombinase/integrase [Bradyrhizobium sp. SZCCHNS3004]
MPKLTNEIIERFVADHATAGVDRAIFDSSVPGFGLRVTAKGKLLWIARARSGDHRVKISLGSYPEKKLSAARAEAHAALQDIREGKDPRAEKAIRRAAIEAGKATVGDLADRWLAEYVRPKLKPRTISDYERIIEDRIKPRLGAVAVASVTKADVISFHASMANTPRRGNYVVATFRALMTFAEDVGLRPPHSNPAKKLKMFRQGVRERFLSEDEIGKAADAIAKAEADGKVGPHAAAGLRLALFTGARSGEITAAKWSHVDWSRKLIRLPDSKTNEARTIHLSEAAIAVLNELPRVGVFIIAGRYKDEPHQNLSRAWIIAREYGGLQDVRLHDLRHSYASLAAGRGVSLQMIGKLLGHKVHATTMRYAHLARDAVADVNDELGAAMQAAITKSKTVDTHD